MVKNMCTSKNIIKTGAILVDIYITGSLSGAIDSFERNKKILPHCIKKLKKYI